jgi:hypothetical protein
MQNNRIMMLYRALLVLLVTLSGAVASETSLRGGEEDSSEEASTINRDLKGNPGGIPICRKTGKVYKPTNLPPIFRLPGDMVRPGYILDETCQTVLNKACPCFTAEEFSLTVNYAQVGFYPDCAPKACIKTETFVDISTCCTEGGCSGDNCGEGGVEGVLSCEFRPDSFGVHFNITAEENEACRAIIINEMNWPEPFPACEKYVGVPCLT